MRDIKFRVWSEHHKKMAFFDNLWITTDSPSTELSMGLVNWERHGSGFYDDHYDNSLDTECPIAMQYTGLKDKNGVEIYEGDIVEWVSTHNGAVQNKHIDEVRWMDDGWYCLYPWIHEIGAAEMLVIGNIYENPELVEEQ